MVEPLRSRTMTLEQLQTRTLKFLKLCRRQLQKMPHEEGLTDVEFIDQVLNQFRDDLLTDRVVLKMAEQREPMDELHYPTEMTAALAEVLGRPNFACGRTADVLRRSGVTIEHKAEAEQAATIHFLIPFALQHGPQWVEHAGQELHRLAQTVPAAG